MKKLFVANFKLYCDYGATMRIAKVYAGATTTYELVVAPATPFLSQVGKILPRKIAAQRCGPYVEGAHTGGISLRDLKSVGAKFVIVGHSESRGRGETDDDIRTKLMLAKKLGITPILCVGESHDERMNDESERAVAAQLRIAKSFKHVVVAYEPVWAVSAKGKGVSASTRDIQEMHSYIKRVTKKARVIYGGSVTSKNFKEIMSLPNVDGVLVGHASTQLAEVKKMFAIKV